MPVHEVSAEQALGGKTLVMSGNPAIVKGLKEENLRRARDLAAKEAKRSIRCPEEPKAPTRRSRAR